MTQQECEKILESMPLDEQARFLSRLGHLLTVVGRRAYEHLGPGVVDPRLLRDLNEIHHRIYAQLESLASGKSPAFTSDMMASWLAAEEKPELLQQACLLAFERCLANGK